MELTAQTQIAEKKQLVNKKQLSILKFGGTSMRTVEIIKHVAQLVKKQLEEYENVIVVVSAMSGMTDKLAEYIEQAEYLGLHSGKDLILSAGEQITTGLLPLCLEKIGVKSEGLCGWQVPIYTSDEFSNAKIIDIQKKHLKALMNNGYVPVVAGFQGVHVKDSHITDENKNNITENNINTLQITTLGRGGSDTTAAALAAYLNADMCEIFTDVPGIFTADPNIVPHAKLIPTISYECLAVLSEAGAKVVHPQAAQIARDAKIPLRIRSTFAVDEFGTSLSDENNNQTTPVCLVHKALQGVKMETSNLSNNLEESISKYAIYSKQTSKNKDFKNIELIFEKEHYHKMLQYLDSVKISAQIFKCYRVQIVNDKSIFNNVNIESLLKSNDLTYYEISKNEIGKYLIVPENSLKTTLYLLHNIAYPS